METLRFIATRVRPQQERGHFFTVFAIWTLGPFWPKRGEWSSLCSVGSIFRNSFNFSMARSLFRFSRPRSRRLTSIVWPSAKNFSAWRTFTIRSFCAARTVICTCFISAAFLRRTFFLLALRFFVTEFVVAHHACHGRFCRGGDKDEVDAFSRPRERDRFFAGNDAEIFTVLADDAEFRRGDLVIHERPRRQDGHDPALKSDCSMGGMRTL